MRTIKEDLKAASGRETEIVFLKEEDTLNRAKWRDEVRATAEGME